MALNYSAYVDLIEKAETDMVSKGIATLDDRLYMLSGIYYATTWSVEYASIHDDDRRHQFERCMRHTYSPTDDPRSIFRAHLYTSLFRSQDLRDHEPVDIGHTLIGLAARLNADARTQIMDVAMLMGSPVSLGVMSTKSTGLEIVTWVGDLGGATGRLALDRADAAAKAKPGTAPMSVPASKYFRGVDYGGPSNLYGDVYAYAIAPSASGTLDRPAIGAPLLHPADIADAFRMFFVVGAKGAKPGLKSDACKTFLIALGGTYAAGTLTNQAAIETMMADKFEAFGNLYIYSYLKTFVIKPPTLPPAPPVPKGGGILENLKAAADTVKRGAATASAAASAAATIESLHHAAVPFLRTAAEDVAKLFMTKLLANNLN
jgi:hypothetical protein